jgi:L-amino acid N-acyltransferase YncA
MIRLATSADAPAIAAIYAPIVRDTAISFEVDPPSEHEMAGRIASVLPLAPWLVCVDPDGVIGYAYASKHRERAAYRWCVDASVYVHERARRRGVARGLYTSLFALLRRQGFYAAHAGITLPNAASVGVHEAMGFRAIGVYPAVGFKSGAWHDVGWWQLVLRERGGEPAPPLPTEAARARPGWAEDLARGEALVRP